jgi:hypothetical protein
MAVLISPEVSIGDIICQRCLEPAWSPATAGSQSRPTELVGLVPPVAVRTGVGVMPMGLATDLAILVRRSKQEWGPYFS